MKDGSVERKWILLPDFNADGNLVTWRNRKLFYADENRLEQIAPMAINVFFRWCLASIRKIPDKLGM
jgi:hypothetical protein